MSHRNFQDSKLDTDIKNFHEENMIIAQELKQTVRCCKDQLLINGMSFENCHKMNKNLSDAWIDYKKAFEIVSREKILKALKHIQDISLT